MNMATNEDFQQAVDLIEKSSSVLITSHTNPDGDSCGCLLVMREVLEALGKEVKPLFLSSVPEWYEFLFDEKVPVLGEDVELEELKDGSFGEFDLIVIVDTNSYSQLPKFEQYLKQTEADVLVLDHHVTSDGLGCAELIDCNAAATGLIVFDLLKYAGWTCSKKAAESIFVAIATDTGWFQFANSDSRAFRCAAELIEAGVKPAEIYRHLYQNSSYPRFKLLIAMLNTLELHLDGRYASQHLLQRDFQQSGAAYEDTEDLINECHRISTVQASSLLVELPDGRTRCSLRSKGPIDVSKIAVKLGGGGHKRAAGAHLSVPMDQAKEIILAEMAKQFSRLNGE